MSICETCLKSEKHVGVMAEAEARLHQDANPHHQVVHVDELSLTVEQGVSE